MLVFNSNLNRSVPFGLPSLARPVRVSGHCRFCRARFTSGVNLRAVPDFPRVLNHRVPGFNVNTHDSAC
jgi:hypothetical protein